MILIDYSQICISNLFANIGNLIKKDPKNLDLPDKDKKESPGLPGEKTKIEEGLLRHMILDSLRYNHMKFKNQYSEMIICCDSGHYWRKDIFPYYKANRKKTRDKSGLNWSEIFDSLNKIRDEISQFLPYRVLNINGAEADDLIGVISKRECTAEKVLILSGDHDFQQLQKYPNIFQYSPTKKYSIISKNPIEDLREFIMCGDRGDGIPNFLSPDDCLVNDIRQTGIRKDHLARWKKESKPENFCDIKMLRGYRRNERLIDLQFIPQELQKNIIDTWEEPYSESRKYLWEYFVKNKLSLLVDKIQDF